MKPHDDDPDYIRLLMTFGFTQLEALVYCQLLRKSPSTPYRIARDIGRSPANIYKTLDALTQKGGIVVSEEASDTPSYRPVPPKQLIARIRRDFENRHDGALSALEGIHAPPKSEVVYQLHNAGHVLDRAKDMIGHAEEFIVFDIMPSIFDMLKAELESARMRGVQIIGIAYRPEDAQPTIPYNGESPSDVASRWPGQGLILIVDGREKIIAQLSNDLKSVMNAVYSDSVFLSSILHSAVSSDIRLVALRANAIDPLKSFSLKCAPPPGLRELRSQSDA